MAKVLKSYRFDDSTIDLIQALKKDLGVSNSSDVLRKAVGLLDKVQKNQEQGGELLVTDGSGKSRSIIFT
jgi:hypothetical protein